MQNIISTSYVDVKTLEIFYIIFLTPSLHGVCFMLMAHFRLHTKYSSGLLDLYLHFIKFTVEEVDLLTQFVPNILKSLPVTEFRSCFKIQISYN